MYLYDLNMLLMIVIQSAQKGYDGDKIGIKINPEETVKYSGINCPCRGSVPKRVINPLQYLGSSSITPNG